MDVQSGQSVIAADGEALGVVATATTGRFLLRSSGREVWLRLEVIQEVSEGQVRLVCSRDGLFHYVATPPALAAHP